MEIDHCLILSAGKGTRMGKIGGFLPKPLWPIGDETLLSYQYKFAKKVGVKNIHINISHQSDLIEAYIKNNNFDITLHYEEELLDIGGTLQNLVNHGVCGSCLVINSDQLFLSCEDVVSRLYKKFDSGAVATLGSIKVNSNESYNRLDLNGNKLVEIVKYGEHAEKQNETYAGIGIVNLDLVHKDMDLSERNFFKLIFNNSENSYINVFSLGQDIFYDLGTKEKYVDFLFSKQKTSLFPNLRLNKYLQNGFYNFGEDAWGDAPIGSVIISGKYSKVEGRCLYFNGVIDLL